MSDFESRERDVSTLLELAEEQQTKGVKPEANVALQRILQMKCNADGQFKRIFALIGVTPKKLREDDLR